MLSESVAAGALMTGMLTPNEVRQWEQAWDAIMNGEQAWKHRVVVLPDSTTTIRLIPPESRCRYCTCAVLGDKCGYCGAPQ